MRELADGGERRLAIRFQAAIQTLFPLVVIGIGSIVLLMAVSFFLPLTTLISRLCES
jgi:type II secretory pathway component PulF